VTTAPSRRAQIVVPATLEALRQVSEAVEDFLAQVDGIEEAEIVTYNIVLAIYELCTNIVTHAYAGEVGTIGLNLLLEESPLCLVVSVRDAAPRVFDEEGWTAPDLDEPKEHGLGIWLIKQLMDEVNYQPSPGNNRWRLVKQIPQRA
jgi:serine/threonine-protein kinase RsbW